MAGEHDRKEPAATADSRRHLVDRAREEEKGPAVRQGAEAARSHSWRLECRIDRPERAGAAIARQRQMRQRQAFVDIAGRIGAHEGEADALGARPA